MQGQGGGGGLGLTNGALRASAAIQSVRCLLCSVVGKKVGLLLAKSLDDGYCSQINNIISKKYVLCFKLHVDIKLHCLLLCPYT